MRPAALSPLIYITAIFVFFGGQIARAQEPFRISANVDRVALDVSVRQAGGGYVKGLPEDAFTVFEDGKQQKILHFDAVDTPVSLGLILDDSGSMRSKRPSVIMAGLAFAKESNASDQFFVVNFNDAVRPGLPPNVPFSDDLQTLRTALYMGQASGTTALYDAVLFGLNHVKTGTRPKKTLIVVSDGGDNASTADKAEVLAMLNRSEVTVYTVGVFNDEDADRNPGVLRQIASLTGGEYFNPQSIDEIIPIFHKIAEDIRNRYTIVYAPGVISASSHSQERSIHISVHSPDYKKLIAKTRTKYELPPSDAGGTS